MIGYYVMALLEPLALARRLGLAQLDAVLLAVALPGSAHFRCCHHLLLVPIGWVAAHCHQPAQREPE